MRRENATELVITAPTKGVITYVPSNQPERDTGRAATFAQNVRFHRGVAASAPGSVAITIDPTGDQLDSAVTMINQPGLSSDFQSFTGMAVILGTGANLYYGSLTGSFASDGFTPVLTMKLKNIFTGTVNAPAPWRATAFFDKAIVVDGAVSPLWWNGTQACATVPGLPPDFLPTGCENVANHLVYWKGRRLLWSDLGDYSNYIPIKDVPCTGRWRTLHNWTMPPVGQPTGAIFLDYSTAKMAVGQWFRVEDIINGKASYLTLGWMSNSLFDQVPVPALPTSPLLGTMVSCPFPQTVAGNTNAGIVSTQIFMDSVNGNFPVGTMFQYDGAPWSTVFVLGDRGRDIQTKLSTTIRQAYDGYSFGPYTFLAPTAANGWQINISVTDASVFQAGDYFSIGFSPNTSQDIYKVLYADLQAQNLAVLRLNLGVNQNSGYPAAPFPNSGYLTLQPAVTLYQLDVGNPAVSPSLQAAAIPPGAVFRPVYGAVFNHSNFTAPIPPGTVLQANAVDIEALGTNEAGEMVFTGGYDEHGEVGQIVRVSPNEAILLKERAIIDMSYVGLPSVFNFQYTITDEGTIDPNAWTRLGSNTIAFLGHRGFYRYTFGGKLEPMCEATMRQVYAELDRSAFNRIRLIHDENLREIHLYYPALNPDGTTSGPERVMIYNYIEDSVTYDNYLPYAIRTVGLVDWQLFSTWASDPITIHWNNAPIPPVYWADASTTFAVPIANIIAYSTGGGTDTSGSGCQLYAYGYGRNRAGVAFHREWQTIDFDFGDSSCFKYLDTVVLALEVLGTFTGSRRLWVQAGARDGLDSAIRWGIADSIDCTGNRSWRPRVNLRRSGRFIRLKFYSDDADIEWRISEFKLVARKGGTS